MKKLLGRYLIGNEYVRITANTEDVGGGFCLYNDQKDIPEIVIGIDYESWKDVLYVLLHEIFEFVMLRMNNVFIPYQMNTGDLSNRLFVFDHSQFSEICGRSSWALKEIIPELALFYAETENNKKKLKLNKKSKVIKQHSPSILKKKKPVKKAHK